MCYSTHFSPLTKLTHTQIQFCFENGFAANSTLGCIADLDVKALLDKSFFLSPKVPSAVLWVFLTLLGETINEASN